MELPHIGQHCSLKECNRLDFLPVNCDACNQVFCVEHYKYESHKCDKADRKNVQVPVCPMCLQPVGIKRDQQPDHAVSDHIDKFCKNNNLIKQNKPSNEASCLQKCSFKSCKQKDIIYLECQDCRTKFCVKHRHPSDHSCPGPPARSFGANVSDNWNSFRGSCTSGASSGIDLLRNKAQQISKSGQAALNRMTTSKINRATSSPSTANHRQTITNLQGNLSEQDALALAIGESLTNQASTMEDRSIDESQDAALARAIHDSELEARLRQRNETNGNNRNNHKANCVLS